MSAPRLLCVAQEFPWPVDNGSTARVIGFLRVLGSVGPVRLVVRPRPSTTDQDVAVVAAIPGVDLVGTGGSFRPRFGALRVWPRALVRRMPPWSVAWYDTALATVLQGELDGATHVIALDDFACQYLPGLRRRRRDQVFVADKHMIYASPTAWGPRPDNALAPLRGAVLRHLATTNERRILDCADRVVVTSPEEATRLRELHGRQPDAVVPTGVEVPPHPWRPPSAAPTVLYLGNLAHGPNRHGVTEVLHAMRAGGVGWRLVIAGKGVDDELRRQADGLDVDFAGFVPDLRPLVASVGAAVVPLWSGAGVRVKVLDLLAAGLPVVTTPAALEATGATAGVHCLVGDTPADLVAALTALLDDPEWATRLGTAGRALVAEHHTWEARRPAIVAAVGLGGETSAA